jgi:hypothetical protein
LEAAIIDIRGRPSAQSNPIVVKMKQHASQVHCVYCDDPIYAFASGCATPPELAIVCPKRFWSHQLTTIAIVEICKQRQVDELVLSSHTGPEWQAWLKADFVNIYQDARHAIFLNSNVTP